jgi:hypothetical protein
MNTIINFISSLAVGSFLIGAVIFGTLSYQFGTFSTYDQCVIDKEHIQDPEYKYRYKNNIFYILYKYVKPEAFQDVKALEKKEFIEINKEYLEKYNLQTKDK